MTRLENWYTAGNPYDPPELGRVRLCGDVFDHPGHHEDGKRVTTSPIEEVAGNVVTTRSGTKYELGAPEQDWLDWLAGQGRTFDPENPIKTIE